MAGRRGTGSRARRLVSRFGLRNIGLTLLVACCLVAGVLVVPVLLDLRAGSGGRAPPPSPPSGASSGPGEAGDAAPYLPYSVDSWWRTPLPDATPTSLHNAQGVVFAQESNPAPYFKIRGAFGDPWGIAYAEAGCDDPIHRIAAGSDVPDSQVHLQTVGFHAPPSLWDDLPPNSDAPFLVLDRCGTSARPNGMTVWGSKALVSGTTVAVESAGSFAHDTNGLDRRDPQSDSPLNERSRGVIPDSAVIRVDVLDWAIRHGTSLGYVLEVFWTETNSAAGFTHPMVGAESEKHGFGAEGQRIRLKAGIDLAARPGCTPTTNPVGLAIARTLQEYGGYLGDNAGAGGAGIKTEQNVNYPGLDGDSLEGCMTWDDLEFLPVGWTG